MAPYYYVSSPDWRPGLPQAEGNPLSSRPAPESLRLRDVPAGAAYFGEDEIVLVGVGFHRHPPSIVIGEFHLPHLTIVRT
jgi:hypothetical protein